MLKADNSVSIRQYYFVISLVWILIFILIARYFQIQVISFDAYSKKSNTNRNKTPFRIPSGLSFVYINEKTGLPSNEKNSIMEAYIEGTEPYSKDDINILDSLGIISNSISGTGGLLNN